MKESLSQRYEIMSFIQKIKRFCIRKIKECWIRMIAALCRMLPIHDNKIVFVSYLGSSYSCNPRYICEYLLMHHPDEYELVWMFDQAVRIPEIFPEKVRVVRYFSYRWLYDVSTARVVICNQRIPKHYCFHRRNGQQYVQTWHSSLRLKKIEKDAEATLSKNYIRDAVHDSKQITHLISGCAFSSQIFRNSFWYNGSILECGTPRIDYLMHESSRRAELCNLLHLDPDTHYVLYAPTFRNSYDLTVYNLDAERLAEALRRRFGGGWKVLFRLHPNFAQNIGKRELPESVLDVSSHPDMQQLLIISDVLLTDYSSCMFDMAYLGKVCVLYASDVKNYMDSDRGMYFDLFELPFPVAQYNDELENIISCFDVEKYQHNLHEFMKRIGSFERGTACKVIVESVLSITGKQLSA